MSQRLCELQKLSLIENCQHYNRGEVQILINNLIQLVMLLNML